VEAAVDNIFVSARTQVCIKELYYLAIPNLLMMLKKKGLQGRKEKKGKISFVMPGQYTVCRARLFVRTIP
jgi:hypothetical protein